MGSSGSRSRKSPAVNRGGHSFGLIIFDCDGVLVDSERIAVQVDVFILSELGWPMDENEVIERFVGRSSESITKEIEAHLGRRLPGEWDSGFEHLYWQALEKDLTPVDGILEALDRIPYPTCVASSGSQDKMRRTLGLTGMYERFRGRIFSVTEVANGKPAPDLFLHAAASMGVEPERCAVIEDSRYGVEAARAAGMRVFGYAGGVTSKNQLEGPGTVIFEDMRDLPALLEED